MTELPEREDFGDYGRWPGRAVLDPTGRRLGEVREIYLDDATDRPEWVLVELEGEAPRFVPLADATIADDEIRVAQASERIEAAPALEPSNELTQEEERRLYSHYGLRYSEDESDSLLPDPEQPSAAETPSGDAATSREGASDAPVAADTPSGDELTSRDDASDAPVAATTGDGSEAATPAGPETPAPPTVGASEAGGIVSPPAAAAAAAQGLDRPRLRRYAAPEPAPAPATPAPEPQLQRAPEAALPAPGETSEPEDTGPMVPPRPEPVAPPRIEPEKPGPLEFLRKRRGPIIAGAVAAIVVVFLRRR